MKGDTRSLDNGSSEHVSCELFIVFCLPVGYPRFGLC